MKRQPKGQPPVFYEADGDTVRQRLLNALKIDLLGPETSDEVLEQPPSTRYLLGMLAPRDTALSAAEDEQSEAALVSPEADDNGPKISHQLAPSSIGLSFIVDENCTSVTIHATWGEYEQVEKTDSSGVNPEQASDIDMDGDPEVTATALHKEYEWVRTPFDHAVVVTLDQNVGSVELTAGTSVEWLVVPLDGDLVVSAFLVNSRSISSGGRPRSEDWMYQPELSVTGDGPVFLPRRLHRDTPDPDPDIAVADLIYRNRREFAVGHGIAVGWDLDSPDAMRTSRVYTTVIPSREVRTVRGPDDIPKFSMDELSEASTPDQMISQLKPLLSAYAQWIERQATKVRSILAPDDEVAREHVQAQRDSLARMRTGLASLRDPRAFEAFKFANRAMAMQRRASERVLSRTRGAKVTPDDQIPADWRPFQIGFILQAITSLVDPTNPDRDVADLLWYPTGGGKTEAYLGLTAFTFALRRLQVEDDHFDFGTGTTVLMRYTLRLLTIQQFHRALALVCACELIRLKDERKWGKERFTIGLWVGYSVTPNNYASSKAALKDLQNNRRVFGGSPYQVLHCPWCGETLKYTNYLPDDDHNRTWIKCSGSECPFGFRNSELGLPALVVDEEIYRDPPSLVLATVDKFAQMAWNGRIRSLFGRVDRRCPRHGFIGEGESHQRSHRATRSMPAAAVEVLGKPLAPPDLIIQDELHLISGPMGSLVGLYETVVDGLSSRTVDGKQLKPKIVASTATVRRAPTQIRAIFDREADVFPPLGIDASDSFFAVEETEKPGRLYVGVFGPGKSIKTTLVRTYSALLSRAQFEFDKAVAADPLGGEATAADAYMTLVGYFNSLRELGGTLRLLDDDVPARLRVLRRRGFGPDRRLFEKDRELTSRRSSSEIADTLAALDRTFKDRESGSYPIDVLLASNMISVGVDINRLGLMVVSAQPKTSAEYIQATSRVGRAFPGLIVEVYNWVRPRDISHYERFAHYHDTFYRHVEATSVTPFSERARDRALRGVLTSFVRQGVQGMAQPEKAASQIESSFDQVEEIVAVLRQRAYRVTGNDDIATDTERLLYKLTDEWRSMARSENKLVYSTWGNGGKSSKSQVLLKHMEQPAAAGLWPVAGSLRDVEEEVDVVLLQDQES